MRLHDPVRTARAPRLTRSVEDSGSNTGIPEFRKQRKKACDHWSHKKRTKFLRQTINC